MAEETIGERLRKLREGKNLSLREVATSTGIDVAILSKMERGERTVSKEAVTKLTGLYHASEKELQLLLLRDKLLATISDEADGLKALQLAEEQLRYKAFVKLDRDKILQQIKALCSGFEGIRKAWVFGSFVRKDDKPGSDIDLALETDEQFSYFDLAEVQHRAEKFIERKVDVGFIQSFKPHVLQHVNPDLLLVYEKR